MEMKLLLQENLSSKKETVNFSRKIIPLIVALSLAIIEIPSLAPTFVPIPIPPPTLAPTFVPIPIPPPIPNAATDLYSLF